MYTSRTHIRPYLRRRTAAWLAAWFVLGTIASPLAHYTWMAVSDAYAMPMMHHAMGESHGEMVATAPIDHVTCNYDEIFATAHSVDVESPSTAVPHDGGGVLLLPDYVEYGSGDEGAIHPRGPPNA